MQVAEVTVRCLRDLDAIDAAIQAEGLCEVQSSLLTTMTYIQSPANSCIIINKLIKK